MQHLPRSVLDLDDENLLAEALGGRWGRASSRARAVIEALGGVRGLAQAEEQELVATGLTARQARRLVAAFELTRRQVHPRGMKVCSPEDAFRVVGDELRFALEERLVMLALDRRRRVLAMTTLTIGSDSFTIVDPVQIYRRALRQGAQAIVLAHNHPSGCVRPSVQDLDVTRRVVAAGRVLGIPLLDHLVVGGTEFTSLAALGELPPYVASPASLAA